ncbi:hypothetical protein BBJ28_00017079 [Nothophytophthora sp. Chile5]|nr:hypothetical protein BBJ28_00017079 [Nothophytophthora sp. Chile5]
MPLYRRGPGFSAPYGLDGTGWPGQRHSYGPPDDAARSLAQLDMRLFSFYFLMAETLATFVGYRIAQHCLRGCRLYFLSPTQRMWIGVFYCWLKIKLVPVCDVLLYSRADKTCDLRSAFVTKRALASLQIDYAFHDTIYYKLSLLIMVVYFVYALLAFGFHFGPLQFLFFDYIPRSKMTQSLIFKLALLCKQVSVRLEFYVLQQLVCLPPLETRDSSAMTASPIASHPLEPPTAASGPAASGFSRVSSFFGREVDVKIELWNRSMCQQWALALSATGRTTAGRRRDHQEDVAAAAMDAFECRFLFVMQQDGLLLGFFLTSPTATLMAKFRDGQAVPFELVLRYHCSVRSALASTQPVFLYAESPRLVGRASMAQKSAVLQLLSQLNAAHGHAVDVPLRSLRCKNFVAAGVGQVVKKKPRNSGAFSGLDSENSGCWNCWAFHASSRASAGGPTGIGGGGGAAVVEGEGEGAGAPNAEKAEDVALVPSFLAPPKALPPDADAPNGLLVAAPNGEAAALLEAAGPPNGLEAPVVEPEDVPKPVEDPPNGVAAALVVDGTPNGLALAGVAPEDPPKGVPMFPDGAPKGDDAGAAAPPPPNGEAAGVGAAAPPKPENAAPAVAPLNPEAAVDAAPPNGEDVVVEMPPPNGEEAADGAAVAAPKAVELEPPNGEADVPKPEGDAAPNADEAPNAEVVELLPPPNGFAAAPPNALLPPPPPNGLAAGEATRPNGDEDGATPVPALAKGLAAVVAVFPPPKLPPPKGEADGEAAGAPPNGLALPPPRGFEAPLAADCEPKPEVPGSGSPANNRSADCVFSSKASTCWRWACFSTPRLCSFSEACVQLPVAFSS